MSSFAVSPSRWHFLIKAGLAGALVIAADRLMYGVLPGSTIGVFAIGWALATAFAQPSIRHDRRALLALGLAAAFGGVTAFDPSLLGWCLFWISLTLAVLLPRQARFGDVWAWGFNIFLQTFTALLGPVTDMIRVRQVRRRKGGLRMASIVPHLGLPLLGGAVFLLLFAMANPLVSDALSAIDPALFGNLDLLRFFFWAIILVAVWATLRPRRLRFKVSPLKQGDATRIIGVTTASVTLSLILFNLMFAMQNALDIAYLWSNTGLPDGMSFAEYAHRGAYPLIATALLAGGFVLLTTQPGSDMAGNKLIRRLVALWVAQNVFLVASSILRVLDYVDVYSLTRLRLSALLWMALVATGLVLIAWRMLSGKTIGWLLNANATAATILLAGCSVVDLGSIAARWNVTHAREVGGTATPIDLCYLHSLGSAALLPLVDLERNPAIASDLRARVRVVRTDIQNRMITQQSDWRTWEWRAHGRLAQLPADLETVKIPDNRRVGCDGYLFPKVPSTFPEYVR